MTRAWLLGLLKQRPLRIWGAALGVALTVAFLASLGAFITSGAESMTRRATASVAVDWQVLLAQGASPAPVEQAIRAATPVRALLPVGYADVSSFSAASGGTVQTTGAGKVLGLPDGYLKAFPAELRALVGGMSGALLSQQTAANLHARVGDRITVARIGLPAVQVRVDGIVDLPAADSLFQAVGAPKGIAPQAPPDNVLLLPRAQWQALFGPQQVLRPDTVREQLHVKLAASLPGDPGAAYLSVTHLANNVEVRAAGSAAVGDNLAASLNGAREDALYARTLFLFLGLPGVLLAAALTVSVAAASGGQRRQETALLRLRGATPRTVARLALAESLLVGGLGVLLGCGLAVLAAGPLLGGGVTPVWLGVAALSGMLLAAMATLLPGLQGGTVTAARRTVGRGTTPLWQQLYLDLLLLLIAGLSFWRSAASGYQLVLAPEGVAQASVQYEAFLAPLALWLGSGLLAMRLLGLLLRQEPLRRVLRPVGPLALVVAAALSRQRGLLARGALLVSLSVAFAVSTAVFNATYNDQARTDAYLTNGSDVNVSGSTAAPAGDRLPALLKLPGVTAGQALMHRFAYVGGDLQDIFGVDAAGIAGVTRLSNSYFTSLTARQAMARLQSRPDALFVSQETVNDYQLRLGDPVRLRLQKPDHQYHVVSFTFVGVVREFPTAPKDSFLIANVGYLASQTGIPAREVALLQASGDAVGVATQARTLTADLAGVQVTDLAAVRARVASSLTAVNVAGLARLELGFAVLLLATATGLVLALGLAERRKQFTVLSALGATGRQLGNFLNAEAGIVAGLGSVFGAVIGLAVSGALVKILQGVFDPPPDLLVLPWVYLGVLLIAALGSTLVAVGTARRASGRQVSEVLRSA
ncbi:FtsX-like permease family protein [Deinococcus sp. UYEF24]